MAPKSRLDLAIESAQAVKEDAARALELAEAVHAGLLMARGDSATTANQPKRRGRKPKQKPALEAV